MKRTTKFSLILAAAAMAVVPTMAMAGPKATKAKTKVPAIGTVKNGYVWDGDEWDSIYDDDDRWDDDRYDRDDWDDRYDDDDDDWDDRYDD